MNSCDSYQELISRLVDGEISPEEHKALMAHMKTCSRCNAMFAVFHDLSDILSEEPVELPKGLHENIMAGVRRSAIIKKNRRMRTFGLRLAMSAAACAVLVLFAAGVFGPGGLKDSTAIRSEEEVSQLRPAVPEITLSPAQDNASPAEAAPAAQPAQAPEAASLPETVSPAWPETPAATPAPAPAYTAPDPYAAAQNAGQTDTPWNADFPAQPEITLDPTYSAPYSVPAQEAEPSADAVTDNTAAYAAEEETAEIPADFFQNAATESAAEEAAAPEIAANLFAYPDADLGDFGAFAAEAPADSGAEAPDSAAPAAADEEPGLVANGIQKRAVPEEPEAAAEDAEPESAEAPDEEEAPAVKESFYSVRGTQGRMELLLRLGGNQAALPDMTPTRLIHVDLLPDDDAGSREKLEIRIYGDFIFFTYFPAGGGHSSFRADCSVRDLDAWLNALPVPTAAPTPTADPFSDAAAGK